MVQSNLEDQNGHEIAAEVVTYKMNSRARNNFTVKENISLFTYEIRLNGNVHATF